VILTPNYLFHFFKAGLLASKHQTKQGQAS